MFATQIFFSLVDFLLLCFWVCFFKGSVRSPGGGHGSPLQYSCLENAMGRGACWPQPMGSQRVGYD